MTGKPDAAGGAGHTVRDPASDTSAAPREGAVAASEAGREEAVDYPLVADEIDPSQVSLGRRLHDPRTLVSFAVPIVLIVLIVLFLRDFDLAQLTAHVLGADPLLLVAAFVVYYLGFPLRGYRWRVLLRGTGTHIRLRDSTEIIFISWLVNCLVPAKLGDVYRAYLLRANYLVSLSRTFGTVFIERVFDLFAIVLLGLAAGFWSFRDGLSPEVELVFGIGLAVVAAVAIGLYTVRNFGRRLLVRLPVPHRVVEFYDSFEEGVFALEARQVPRIAIVTALIWATEATRLYLVVLALGFDLPLGISGAFFVALIASLLTAVPFTPAGLGLVEAGIATVLTLFYGATVEQAGAIAIVDRLISVVSIIVLGSIAYVVSAKTKSGPRASAAESPAT